MACRRGGEVFQKYGQFLQPDATLGAGDSATGAGSGDGAGAGVGAGVDSTEGGGGASMAAADPWCT